MIRRATAGRRPWQRSADTGGCAGDGERPNVVLLTVDSLRTDRVGAYRERGSAGDGVSSPDRACTPNVDEFAEGSCVFTRSFINGIGTPKSFPAILAGSYPLSFDGPARLGEQRTTAAELLSGAGYRTVGYSTNHYLSYQAGYHRGFEEFHELYDLVSDHREPLVAAARRLRDRGADRHEIRAELYGEFRTHYEETIAGCEEYLDATDWRSREVAADLTEIREEYRLLRSDFDAYLERYADFPASRTEELLSALNRWVRSLASRSDLVVGAYRDVTGYREKPYVSATSVTDRVVDRVRAHGEDRPLFLWAHYMDAHVPFLPGEDWPEEYARYLGAVGADDEVSPAAVDQQDPAVLESLYDACVRYVDEQIGRVLAALEDVGRDTLVIVTSDHGEEFGDHGGTGHDARLYEELVRVPTVVGTLGTDEGLTDDRLFSHVDLVPSVIAPAAGIGSLPAGIEGEDVFETERDHVLTETLRDVRAPPGSDQGGLDIRRDHVRLSVRTAQEKVIHHEEDDHWEYYDLSADPGERNDLASTTSFEPLRRLVEERLREIRASRAGGRGDIERPEIVERRLEELGYLT